jgi:general secretion pathway protein A
MKSPYLDYFNLTEEPFSTVPSPRFFLQTRLHGAAYQKTKYTVDARKGLATVIGDTGTGKSTLARLLHEKFLEEEYISILLTNPNLPTPNFLLRTIMQEYGIQTRPSFKDNLDIFKEFVFTNAVEFDKTIVLMIDEAQVLKPALFELLRQLMNFETNEKKLINIVLFGQDELRNKLSSPRNKNFKSRITMASTLDKVDVTELENMLSFRWSVASGGNTNHPFTKDAVHALFVHSEGIPREAFILADNALLAAFLEEKSPVDPMIIDYGIILTFGESSSIM